MVKDALKKCKITLFMVMIPTADQCSSGTFRTAGEAEYQCPDTDPQPQLHFSSEPPRLRKSAFSSYSGESLVSAAIWP